MMVNTDPANMTTIDSRHEKAVLLMLTKKSAKISGRVDSDDATADILIASSEEIL